MLHHAFFGFLRVSLIGRRDEVISKKLFRRRILRDTPAIRSSVPVLHIDEIRDADIALHLQPRDARLKTGVVCRLWQNEVTTHHSERRQQTMSEKIVQLNEEIIKGQLKELV